MTRCPCYQIISTTTVWFPGWCPQSWGRMPRAAFIIRITGHVLNTTSWGPYANSCSKETWAQAQAGLLWKFRHVHQSATLGPCGTTEQHRWILDLPLPSSCTNGKGLRMNSTRGNGITHRRWYNSSSSRLRLSLHHTSLCPDCPGKAQSFPRAVPCNRSELGTSFTQPLYQTMVLYCFTGRTCVNCAPNPKSRHTEPLGLTPAFATLK